MKRLVAFFDRLLDVLFPPKSARCCRRCGAVVRITESRPVNWALWLTAWECPGCELKGHEISP